MLEHNTPKNFQSRSYEEPLGYSDLFKQIAVSAKDLVQSEVALVTAELKDVSQKTSKDLVKVAIFGTIALLSALPFIAFLVLGLGELLDHRYWLSSLIVAIAFAAVGGVLAMTYLQKIKEKDLNFSATKQSLRREKFSVQQQIHRVKTAAQGETYATNQLH